MKKGFLVLTILAMMLTIFAGCGSKDTKKEGSSGKGMKVGMVTDSGTIDDKSFNQGTWEGILKAKTDLGISEKYIKPAGTTEADYLKEIGNLYDAGYKFIVTPGFKFETAIFAAQDKYKDAKFVLLDGTPHPEKGDGKVGDNSVAVFFAEHESGFIAGVATALQLKEGEAGFIGGMKIPAVQKYNWGFQQGLKYANDNFGTKISLKKENVIYQGSFSDVAAGQQLAAQMYDRGVNVIFTAAGGVGVGSINEAKTRKNVWIVGVDVDQYKDGVYDEANNKSIILTSAMKKIDIATFDIIKQEQDGKFPGGQTLTLDAKNDGVGIPTENPNLSADTVKQVADVFAKLKSGDIKVAAEATGLIEPQ
ncbi:BMP family lipoprotein [Gorillibacterium massiliense]|uniref:BMP family lipoprotein n=1 Tax=Gorillibacterium massiliense TaxID=1280390 RepID=UPI0004AF2F18|nr:BMP family ABC transporter substrate-binding protein [Gorillibacterium massiliense]